MNFLSFVILRKRIRAISAMMKDREVSVWKKLLIVFGIVYLFLPIDLIPPVFFPFGFIDDLVIWLIIIWNLKDTLDKYWKEDVQGDFAEDMKDKTMVEDVEYTVDADRDEGSDAHTNRSGAGKASRD